MCLMEEKFKFSSMSIEHIVSFPGINGMFSLWVTLILFFFLRENQKCVKRFFGLFFRFFHGQKIAFTQTFLQVFTEGKNFSWLLSKIFSRKDLRFHGEDSDIFWKYSRVDFVFHRCKMNKKTDIFHVQSLQFSRTWYKRKFQAQNR